MKIAKIATVSTITLGIAMSAAALSAGPSLAQEERPRLILLGKQACSAAALPLDAAGTATPTGVVIEFRLGRAKPVQLLFSTELAYTVGTNITLTYSIDGATVPVQGPTNFDSAITTVPTTHTAYGLTNSLARGKHTIQPLLTSSAGAAGTTTAGNRCFAVMNTGR